MSQPFSETVLAFGHPGRPLNLTLVPLQRGRQATLAPDPALGIRAVTLTRIGKRWRNAFNEVIIREADDLFACADREGCLYDPVPLGAELVEARLDIRFADRPQPRLVLIKPPHTLVLQDQSDTDRILTFLLRRGFILSEF